MDFGFGLLDQLWNGLKFEHGEIQPIIEREELIAWIERNGYQDGPTSHDTWIYPPMVYSERVYHGIGPSEVVPKSRRPSHLWSPDATHRLVLSDDIPDPGNNNQRLIPSVLLEAIAFLFATRLQFADWRFDSRVPVHGGNPFLLHDEHLTQCMNYIVQRCLSLSKPQLVYLRNILFLYNKVRCYEWEWEQFAWTYTVVDGCWRFLSDKGEGTGEIKTAGLKRVTHGKRLIHMCEQLGIGLNEDGEIELKDDKDVLEFAVHVRNELIHEFTWRDDTPEAGVVEPAELQVTTPGYGFNDRAFYLALQFRHFAQRLVLHCLGIPCEARKAGGWSKMCGVAFGLKRGH